MSFPPEIFERIFAFACTDDGTTGRSLSMVSRSVHNTSISFKYYSVAITGPRQAVGFAELMENFPDCSHHVSHLFVSNRQSPLTVNDITADADSGGGSATSILRAIPPRLLSFIPATKQQREWDKMMGQAREHARKLDCLKVQSCQQDELTLRTLLRILEILAPNLETLSVFFESRWLSLPSWESAWRPTFPSLPALTDLTITYRALVHAEWSQWGVISAPKSLPSLKRLDISGVEVQYYSPFHCHRCMSKRTPSLTHLCIPARMADSMARALAENRPEFEEDLRGILPPNFEHVLIQLSQPPQFTCCGGAELYAEDCASCHSLSKKDERFCVLEPDRSKSNKSQGTVKQEWLDRIDGGEGNWGVHDRVAAV